MPDEERKNLSELCHFFPRQLEATKEADAHTYTLYGGSAGPGKLINVDTLIPTPEGFVRMGDLNVGEWVISSRGVPVQIIWTSDIENNPDAYELEFDTGEKIQCDARHLWLTRNAKERAQVLHLSEEWRQNRKSGRASRAVEVSQKPWASKSITAINKARVHQYKEVSQGTVRTAREIAETLMVRGTHNHSIDTTKPLDLPEALLPIDPYLFGLWLGDGFSGTGVVGMAQDDMDVISPMITGELSFRVDTRNRKSPFKMMRVKGMTAVLKSMGCHNYNRIHRGR